MPDNDVAGELSIEVAESIGDLEQLQADYERLHRATRNVSPFALFEWHRVWCAHFLNLDPRVTDALAILVMRDASRECVAIVPLVVSRRRFGPLHLVTLELLGADPSTTESRTPLIEPGHEAAAVRALRRWLTVKPDWDWVTWGGVEHEFARAVALPGGPAPQSSAPGYVLDLAPTWPEFRARLKRNIRESLRHCYNSLRRDRHRFSLETAAAPAEVRVAIGRFLDLHAQRAAMPGTVVHPNHFAGQATQRFLYEVCDRLALRGVVRVFQLRIGDEIVAARIGFVVGGCLYLYYSGFDPRWARYGVMTTLLAEALQYAIAANLSTVNLSRGTDTSKTRWSPRAIEYLNASEVRNRRKSRLAHVVYRNSRSDSGIKSWLRTRLGKVQRHWDT